MKEKNRLIDSITFTWRNKFPIMLLLFFLFFQLSFGIEYVWVKPYEIKFNYEPGQSNDAVNIRKDFYDDISIPEWEYNGGNSISKKFAYIKEQSNRKIQVRFYSNCEDMHLIINLTITSGLGIGEVCNYFVANYTTEEEEDWITLTLDGNIPNSVGIRSFTWKWEIYGIPNDISTYCAAQTNTYTSHTYYTLLATPQSPMAEPWTDVLDFACDWASGQSTEYGMVSDITEGAYNNINKEYSSVGTHAYLPYFDLTGFLDENWADCRDMSAVVQVFTNAIGGANIMVRSIDYYSGGYFSYKPICAIGANCNDPDDWEGGYWNFHQFGYLNNVFDACLKLNQSYPRIPVDEAIDESYKTDLFESGSWNKDEPTVYIYVY